MREGYASGRWEVALKEREKLKSKAVGLTIRGGLGKITDEKKLDDSRAPQENELDSCVEKLNEIWGIIAKNNLFQIKKKWPKVNAFGFSFLIRLT